MGSKSKYRIMKSSQTLKKKVEQKKSKKENTLDTISKSLLTCPSVEAGTNEY